MEYLVIKTISGERDNPGSRVKRERVHAPIRNERVRNPTRCRSAIQIRRFDSTDDGAAFGVFENVERKRWSLERRSVVVHILNLEQKNIAV